MHDAINTLESIRDFLSRELLQITPQSVRSELRAAIKLIEDLQRELEVSPVQMEVESLKLLTLCDAYLSCAMASEENPEIRHLRSRWLETSQKVSDARLLSERTRSNNEVNKLASEIFLNFFRYQDSASSANSETQLILELILELRNQSLARSSWQSVFRVEQSQ